MRKITVLTTIGKSGIAVHSQAQTWGELKIDLSEAGVITENMNVVEGTTRVTLENNEAQIPAGDFKIFMTPKETKSGGSSNPVRQKVRYIIETVGEKAKAYFNRDDVNYTNKKASELESLVYRWEQKKGAVTVPEGWVPAAYKRHEKPAQVAAETLQIPEDNGPLDYSAKAIKTRLLCIQEQLTVALGLADLAAEAEEIAAGSFAHGSESGRYVSDYEAGFYDEEEEEEEEEDDDDEYWDED